MHEQDARAVLQALDAWCRRDDLAGWDPFDGLGSRLFRCSGLNKSRFARLAWLQLFKRLPVNLRGLAMVPKTHNAKAIALFLRSYLAQGRREEAGRCLSLLLSLRADPEQWGKAAWGYPFDWQAKAFFVGKGTPNVICTAYAVRALEEARDAGLAVEGGLIEAASEFIASHLVVSPHIAYVPGAQALVHNASLWGAYVLLAGGNPAHRLIAQDAVELSLAAQNEDGGWPYGTLPHHRFIDGFHTGYNLEALSLINRHLENPAVAQAVERGLDYYRRTFFAGDGCPHYYHNTPYPLDPHSTAQGVLTLMLLQPDGAMQQAGIVLKWVCEQMRDAQRGCFYYQRHRHYTNKIAYMRWTQAWMHLALSVYIAAKAEGDAGHAPIQA